MNRRGMTLLELLVAMILTGIVAFIAYELLLAEKVNYTVTRRKVGLQSDAREAMRILEEEIKNTGFSISTNYVAWAHLVDPECSQVNFTATDAATDAATGAAIDPSPSASIFGAKTVGFAIRFYNPMNGSSFSCSDDRWTIGYKYDSTTKVLSRQAVKGTSKSLTADGFVPLLDSVQEFSVRYGLFQEDDTLLTKKDVSASVWNNASGVTQSSTNDTTITFTFPSPAGTYDLLLQKQLGPGNLDPKATYRISFWVSSSDSVLDSLAGLGSTSVLGQGRIIGGFFNGNTIVDTITFRPLKVGVMRQVQFDLVHKNASQSSGNVNFGMRVKFLGDVSSTNPNAIRKLTIYGLSVTRLNSGLYYNWVDAATAATAANAYRIRAVRLRMTASNKKHSSRGSGSTSDNIVLDRIIPMVNNGN